MDQDRQSLATWQFLDVIIGYPLLASNGDGIDIRWNQDFGNRLRYDLNATETTHCRYCQRRHWPCRRCICNLSVQLRKEMECRENIQKAAVDKNIGSLSALCSHRGVISGNPGEPNPQRVTKMPSLCPEEFQGGYSLWWYCSGNLWKKGRIFPSHSFLHE